VEIPRHFVPRNDMLNEFSSSGYYSEILVDGKSYPIAKIVL
jgi:hypothetical protein